MDAREKGTIEQIRLETEYIEIPETLEPDRIERLLEERRREKRLAFRKFLTAAAAACLVLVCTGGLFAGLKKAGKWAQNGSSSDATADTAEEPEDTSDDGPDGGRKNTGSAEVYKQAYACLMAFQNGEGVRGFTSDTAETADAAMETESAAMDTATNMAAGDMARTAESGGYSSTNVRQEGVDEADIVKTDGRYLYTLADDGSEISVVDTEGGMRRAASIPAEKEEEICEFYVTDGKVVVISGAGASPITALLDTDLGGKASKEQITKSTDYTRVTTYDVTDPGNPTKLGDVSQSGYYTSSRLSGSFVYVFSDYSVGGIPTPKEGETPEPLNYIPLVDGELVAGDDICLPQGDAAYMYEIVTSVGLGTPGVAADSKAILTNGGSLYVSGQSVYWYESDWGDDGKSVTTNIRKLSYQNGRIKEAAQGEVKGWIEDSFSIDEYGGNLRVVTSGNEANAVYVLDSDLRQIGAIEGLAEDERVYSARFMGDTAYFVTFRETDPLFSVDLSDPEDPKILGELKIPGFSEYLHYYGGNQLLGIGMDADEESGVTSCIKLSMFDISDNTDVKERDKYLAEEIYSTDALYDYKSVLIDPEKNLIGFSGYNDRGESYYVFSYDGEDGFTCRMREKVNGGGYRAARGVYIGNILYVVKGNVIEAYSLTDYNKVDDIIL